MWFEIYLFIFTTKKENTFVASEQDIKELFIHKIIIIDINFFLIIHKKKKKWNYNRSRREVDYSESNSSCFIHIKRITTINILMCVYFFIFYFLLTIYRLCWQRKINTHQNISCEESFDDKTCVVVKITNIFLSLK